METIMYVNALLFFLGICCLVRYAYLRCSDDETETELERNQREADKLAVRADEIAVGIIKSEEHAERIRENQRAVEKYFGTASESVSEAKGRSKESVDLIDECLSILEEAEEKSRKS